MNLFDFLEKVFACWNAGEDLVPFEMEHWEVEDCGNSYVKIGEALCESLSYTSPLLQLIFSQASKELKSQFIRGCSRHEKGLTVLCDVRIMLETTQEPGKEEFLALKAFIDKTAEIAQRENIPMLEVRGSLRNERNKGRTDYSLNFQQETLIRELTEFSKGHEVLNATFILLAKRLSRIGRYSWSPFNAEDIFGQRAVFMQM